MKMGCIIVAEGIRMPRIIPAKGICMRYIPAENMESRWSRLYKGVRRQNGLNRWFPMLTLLRELVTTWTCPPTPVSYPYFIFPSDSDIYLRRWQLRQRTQSRQRRHTFKKSVLSRIKPVLVTQFACLKNLCPTMLRIGGLNATGAV